MFSYKRLIYFHFQNVVLIWTVKYTPPAHLLRNVHEPNFYSASGTKRTPRTRSVQPMRHGDCLLTKFALLPKFKRMLRFRKTFTLGSDSGEIVYARFARRFLRPCRLSSCLNWSELISESRSRKKRYFVDWKGSLHFS